MIALAVRALLGARGSVLALIFGYLVIGSVASLIAGRVLMDIGGSSSLRGQLRVRLFNVLEFAFLVLFLRLLACGRL